MSVLIYLFQHLWSLPWSPFLCLLHINFWVLICVLILLKVKCDHIHHGWTNGFAPTWWKWSRRAFSLLTAYKILNSDFIMKRAWQRPSQELQYNTCRRRTKHFSALGCLIFLTTCLSALYLRLTTYSGWCVSSLLSMYFFSAGGANFGCIYRLKTRPHDYHSIIGFDHIFDHKQNRSTRRQDVTRVWKSRFCVAERARKSKNG